MATLSAAEKLGKIIRARRKAIGLPQDAFADKVGVHRTYIGSVERGERNVSLENILRIAKALGLKAAKLFEEAGL